MDAGQDGRVCSECVDEPFLRSQMETDGVQGTCSYCEMDGSTYSINQVADRISAVRSCLLIG